MQNYKITADPTETLPDRRIGGRQKRFRWRRWWRAGSLAQYALQAVLVLCERDSTIDAIYLSDANRS
jgi:hypothetical protein